MLSELIYLVFAAAIATAGLFHPDVSTGESIILFVVTFTMLNTVTTEMRQKLGE